jgi:hypothetical protein
MSWNLMLEGSLFKQTCIIKLAFIKQWALYSHCLPWLSESWELKLVSHPGIDTEAGWDFQSKKSASNSALTIHYPSEQWANDCLWAVFSLVIWRENTHLTELLWELNKMMSNDFLRCKCSNAAYNFITLDLPFFWFAVSQTIDCNHLVVNEVNLVACYLIFLN